MNDNTVLMSAKPLRAGYQLAWYTIKSVLGHGGFGITYLAHDNNLDREVAIKEYLPTSFACRHEDHSVNPITGSLINHYKWGLERFLIEAQTLAKFKHNNIVGVHSVFEQNGTAYMVMEYETGESLAARLAQGKACNQNELEDVFFPIFDGLTKIHDFGFIHRDIKPANIYIRHDNSPVLIDFGSARQTSAQNTGDMTTLVSQGYTPLEQYSSDYGQQGPWTDIYSLAATLHHTITGSKPADAISRSARKLRQQPDPVTQLIDIDYPGFSQIFLDAVNQGLALQQENRPQNITQWMQLFGQSPGDTQWVQNTPTNQKVFSQPGVGAGLTQLFDNTSSDELTELGVADRPTRPRFSTQQTTTDFDITGIRTQLENTARTSTEFVGKTNKMQSTWPAIAIIATLAVGTLLGGLVYMQYSEPDQVAGNHDANATLLTMPVSGTETQSPPLTKGAKVRRAEPAAVAVEPEIAVESAIAAKPATAVKTALRTENEDVKTVTTDQPSSVVSGSSTPLKFVDLLPGIGDNAGQKSLAELITSTPKYPPVEGLDDSYWKTETCANCHEWQKSNLCTQGEFYLKVEESALSRIQHPFGGFFKKAVKQWAKDGCL